METVGDLSKFAQLMKRRSCGGGACQYAASRRSEFRFFMSSDSLDENGTENEALLAVPAPA